MQRYDQRVRAFVGVRGGEADWELAGERFAAHGWPVRDSAPAGAGPLGDAVEARPESRVYEIEVRLPGIAKGADLGAARRVAKALRAARLEGYVRRAEVLHRDRERPSYWRAVDTSARPRPAGSALAHTWYRVRLGLGLADREALLHAESAQALWLARAGRGADALLTGVRPLDGRWRQPVGSLPEELVERRLWAFFLWALAAAGTLPFLAGRSGWPLAFWLVVSGICVMGTLRAGARLGSPRRLGDMVLAIFVLVFFALVVTGGSAENRSGAPRSRSRLLSSWSSWGSRCWFVSGAGVSGWHGQCRWWPLSPSPHWLRQARYCTRSTPSASVSLPVISTCHRSGRLWPPSSCSP